MCVCIYIHTNKHTYTQIWDVRSAHAIHEGEPASITGVKLVQGGLKMVTCDSDGMVKLWDVTQMDKGFLDSVNCSKSLTVRVFMCVRA